MELALRASGVPYQLVRGVEFYQRKEIKDLLAYLQLLNNPRDAVAWRRIINLPPRGIGKTTIEAMELLASQNGVFVVRGDSSHSAIAAVDQASQHSGC